MTSGEHTKGHTELPWSINPHHPRLINGGQNRREVAKTAFGTDDELDENTANANLIVTAVNTYPAVAELVESLMHCQSVLAMVISPHAIQTSSVQNAFAQATEAECKARSALTRFREAQAGGGA